MKRRDSGTLIAYLIDIQPSSGAHWPTWANITKNRRNAETIRVRCTPEKGLQWPQENGRFETTKLSGCPRSPLLRRHPDSWRSALGTCRAAIRVVTAGNLTAVAGASDNQVVEGILLPVADGARTAAIELEAGRRRQAAEIGLEVVEAEAMDRAGLIRRGETGGLVLEDQRQMAEDDIPSATHALEVHGWLALTVVENDRVDIEPETEAISLRSLHRLRYGPFVTPGSLETPPAEPSATRAVQLRDSQGDLIPLDPVGVAVFLHNWPPLLISAKEPEMTVIDRIKSQPSLGTIHFVSLVTAGLTLYWCSRANRRPRQ